MTLVMAGAFIGQHLQAQNYSITVNIIGNGVVDRTPPLGQYASGTVVLIDAVADPGWTFSHWSDDLSGTDASTSITMDSDKTITANFTQDSYTLTLLTSGNGSASKSPDQSSYLSFEDVDIQATPDVGWNFTGWTGDLVSTDNPATVNMDDNKIITANFAENTYLLTVVTDGTADAEVTPATPTVVTHGDPQVITATAPDGYDFVQWTITSGTGATIGNVNQASTSITLTSGNVTVEASFALKQYTLTVITDGTSGTAVSPASPVLVTHGVPEIISVVTIPDGYELDHWTVISGEAEIDDPTMDTTTATLTSGNAIIQANFELKQYTLTLLTDGTPDASTIPDVPVQVTHGQARIITAVVPDGYDFIEWTVVSGTVTLGNATNATTTATLITDDVILRATYALKQYTLSLITDGTPGAEVTPALPVMVEHGVPEDILVSATPVGYAFDNWTVVSGAAVIDNDTMEITTATLTLGNATVQANFLKVLEIIDVTIPNVTMKIGDVVTATIQVSNDAGSPYFLISGTIGGYPLMNLQRLNATTYLASFTIIEGGSNYAALDNIPVTNLVLSDGALTNIPYNLPIIQNNDAIDAKLPVVNSMTVASAFYKVGDIVTLNINADSTHYTAHPLTTINGTAVSATNVTFVEVGNGDYRLIYTILEGDNDVLEGQLAVSVILVKPSGNFNSIPYTVIDPNTLRIDANSPVTTRMEVSQTEVGVGNAVQVVVTADGLGYSGGIGTVVNGVPISSERVSVVEQAGGLYVLNYVVAAEDNNVSPGSLTATVVMTDSAGNNSLPYSTMAPNILEIYTDLPVATLAAPPEICEGEDADLTVFLSGRSPWSFDLSDGTTVTSYTNIMDDTYRIPITPDQTTTYEIDSIWDRNDVVNTGAGSVQVVVRPITDVQITNLAAGYSIDDDAFRLSAIPTGGTFTGPGVVPATGYFYPSLAGTENSPHTIYYTLINQYNCTSMDSAMVFVLSAEGDIFIPDTAFCNNNDPFTITASNLAGATGSLSLRDINNNTVPGLSDNGDNTAMVLPSMMNEGKYIIVYEYFDGIPLYLRDTFSILAIEVPAILNLNNTYCQSDDPVLLESSVTGSVFSGPGVSGNITDGFLFYPDSAEAGTVTITCTVTSVNGCIAVAQQDLTLLFTPEMGFELSTACISDDGGIIMFENTTSDKLQVETWLWDFGDPASGDDNQSDLINPSHLYPSPGDWIISLTATTFEGCVETYVMDTVLGNMPEADFIWKSDCYGGEQGSLFINKSVSEFSPLIGTKFIFRNSYGTQLGEVVSDTHLDSATFVFDSQGEYIVQLLVESSLGCTDTVWKDLMLKETLTPGETGYTEGFDDFDGNWAIGSETEVASWVWGVPDFDGFAANPSDKAWYTSLPDGVVGYMEHSWMESPCFDFSDVDHPLIQLDIMKSFASGNGAVLQYMDLYEEGWKTVGTVTTGTGWYNSDNIQNQPGGSSTGWGWDIYNPDDDWVTAVHNMDMLAGKPYVSFRIAYVTDEAEGVGNQGFAFDNVNISERSKLILLEHFTNSSDAASFAADEAVDEFATEHSRDLIDIQYHMDYPGVDPMNANNPEPASVRSFNYGVPQVPYAILDGGINEDFRYNFSELKTTPSEDNIAQLILQVPAFEVDLDVEWMDEELEATTTVTCNVDHYAEYIQLYVVVIETSVNAYSGLNGDTAFRNVVLKMLPNAAGKLLGDDWSQGDSDTRVNSWLYESYVEDVEDLAVVAFVQDRNTKQVLQAAVDHKTPLVGIGRTPVQMETLSIYPNPARSFININTGRPAEKEGRFVVIDMNGRIVQSEHVPPGYQIYQLNVQSLDHGFYMLQWYEDGVLKGRNKLVVVD